MTTRDWFDVLCGAVTIFFAIRTLVQQHLSNALRETAGYFAQGVYNNFFQIGSTAENALKTASPEKFREALSAVASSTQTARHHVTQFAKNSSHITVSFEPAGSQNPSRNPRKRRSNICFS
jgi:hypothetical protein